MPAAVSNAGLARALLQRGRKEWERDATGRGLQNDKERELYIELRQNKFDDDDIDAAGAGTANADLLAYDGARLWIVEVKGHNDWLSRNNQQRRGNVPLKQIGQKLKGKLGKEITVSKVDVTVEASLQDPKHAGRRPIGLTVTNLDTQGALLAMQMVTTDEGDVESTYYATTINQVIRFFDDVLERYLGSSEDAAKPVNAHGAVARRLVDAWRSGYDPDEFLVDHGPNLETIYTAFRKVTTQRQPQAEFDKLDDDLDVNIALLPVRKTLPRVARRAVLARTKFKNGEEALRWFRGMGERLPREEDEDDDSWVTRLLSADPTYGGATDFYANYELLTEALAPQEEPPQVPQREAPKGKKHRTVDATIWNHIVNGEVKVDIVGTKKERVERVAGLHTIRGDRPVGEGYGPKTPVGDLGCYKQAVRVRRQGNDNGPQPQEKDKKLQSTFFPDAWTLEDIREAIEYAAPPRNNSLEVLSPAKGIGMTLWFNGESYYPNYR